MYVMTVQRCEDTISVELLYKLDLLLSSSSSSSVVVVVVVVVVVFKLIING